MPEWLVLLVMVAVFAALAMAARFPIGIALALAAVAGSLIAGKGVSVRHLIEGGFGYFDTILIIITATIFIKVLEASGILDSAAEKQRNQQAEKLGFSAYAISADMNDPVVKAIHGLIDHSAHIDHRLDLILAQLQKLGAELPAGQDKPDDFDPNYLNKIVD